MSRVKRGTIKSKHRSNILAQVKGYRFGRSTKKRQAREAIVHAGSYAFAHRRDKKGVRRRLWTVKINCSLRTLGTTYSKFIGLLKKKNIEINRKMLAQMAEHQPDSFKRFVEKTK